MSNSAKTIPAWGFFSLVTNSILVLAVILLIWRQQRSTAFLGTPNSPVPTNSEAQGLKPDLGPRHKLSYQQWVEVLQQEANFAANQSPRHLTILAGDSLSLWFPPELLPEDRYWLNQGISGETSGGLLKRLNLFDRTRPEEILVMIGINDLIKGVSDEEILDNQRQIMHYLRKAHPKTRIVIQSILPHAGEDMTWEGKARLLAIPNSRIRRLNRQLRNLATKERVKYLDLHPLFANQQGNLYREFTTDGLHLNPQGYIVWRTALQIYNDQELKPLPKKSKKEQAPRI